MKRLNFRDYLKKISNINIRQHRTNSMSTFQKLLRIESKKTQSEVERLLLNYPDEQRIVEDVLLNDFQKLSKDEQLGVIAFLVGALGTARREAGYDTSKQGEEGE
ncbi:MAG: hypothetical protein GTO02_22385 [Candidatus Dadabacteria bacterium]|nr:hypothetical protein [Candidatus Dadabacteria bacterium]